MIARSRSSPLARTGRLARSDQGRDGARSDQGRENGRADQGRADQGRADQGRGDQGRADQNGGRADQRDQGRDQGYDGDGGAAGRERPPPARAFPASRSRSSGARGDRRHLTVRYRGSARLGHVHDGLLVPTVGRRADRRLISILTYIRDTAKATASRADPLQPPRRELHGSEDARWTVLAERADGEQVTVSCDFLYACTGYYRYDGGTAVHRQRGSRDDHSPATLAEDLDCAGSGSS
jgi:hypothetical protein